MVETCGRFEHQYVMTHYFPGKICSAPELITEGEEDGKREWGRSRTKGVSSEAESEQLQASSSTNEASSTHSPVSDNHSLSVPSIVSTNSPSTSAVPSISVSTSTLSTTSSPSTTASKVNPDCVNSTYQDSSLIPTQTPKNPSAFSKMPNMIPRPGTEVRFTKFPAKPYKDGATPSEVTQHCLDSTYSVRCMLEGLER